MSRHPIRTALLLSFATMFSVSALACDTEAAHEQTSSAGADRTGGGETRQERTQAEEAEGQKKAPAR